MSDYAIKIEGLGKQYRIGAHAGSRKTLREVLTEAAMAPFRRARAVLRGEAAGARGELFWALQDVSFEVGRGEVVGIIGRNGAGKSTLLKVLSRITEPTCGEVRMRGRVGALLEVGTGFHSELSGRDNILLNGAILGMRRAEIRRKFDDIVAFAEVDKFIDTPVKHYSSGMYMRLAFAVAAHLDPEILIVDEVLAVGDVQFQKKCLGKMGEVAGEGKTVLLVSHNMGVISQFSKKCLWLDAGRAVVFGPTSAVLKAYLESSTSTNRCFDYRPDPAKASQLRVVRLLNQDGAVTEQFSCDEPVIVELIFEVRRQVSDLFGYFQVSKLDGTSVMVSYSHDLSPDPLHDLPIGLHSVRVIIPPRTLGHGDYIVNLATAKGSRFHTHIDICPTICRFSLSDLSTLKGNERDGCFSTILNWGVTPIPVNEWAGAGSF